MNKDVTTSFSPETEPSIRQGSAFLPMWLTAMLGLLFYWGCYYIDEHGGRFNEFVYAPFHSTNELTAVLPVGDPMVALGAAKYKQICAPCHQDTGLGVPNQFPPLAGSEWVNTPSPMRMLRIAQTGLSGPIKVKGTDFNAVMPPMGATMTDEELAAVVSYVRNSFGNKAPKATVEQVRTVRAALGGSTDPQTVDVLLKVPESE